MSSVSSLSGCVVPPYRFFPTDLWETQGPRQWARLRLLQACERLKIPRELWPEFKDLIFPPDYGHGYLWDKAFELPEFAVFHESESEWRTRARKEFDQYCDEFLDWCRHCLRNDLEAGKVRKVPATRDTTPLDLRYEWAARRYCLRWPYKKLAAGGYTESRIKRTVLQILKEAGLQVI